MKLWYLLSVAWVAVLVAIVWVYRRRKADYERAAERRMQEAFGIQLAARKAAGPGTAAAGDGRAANGT